APQMLGVERLAKLPEASERHREGDVAVTSAHLEEARDAHSGAVGSARGELGARLALELIERRAGCGEARLIQRAAPARAWLAELPGERSEGGGHLLRIDG